MKITLSKEVKVNNFEFVGELNFFETSPYIALLKDLETEEDLIELLEEKSMPLSAINNVIQKLEELQVLENGIIQNIEDGFPEKEYGKYTFSYFENNTMKPFKYLAENIRREKPVSRNIADNISQVDRDIQDFIKKKHNTFNGKEAFEILKIEASKGLLNNVGNKNIDLVYEDEKWNYIINAKKSSMENIDLNVVFRKEWDEEYLSFKVEYDWIKDKLKVLESFIWSFELTEYKVFKYGEFAVNFENIPIIPKTENDALKWFTVLLKLDIENKNRYISKDELKQLWLNLKDKKPKFKKFDLEFNFERILKEFGKDSKYYWLLQAGIDLYPFDNSLAPKSRIIIENINDFEYKFKIDVKTLIIMDIYINTERHFLILEKILKFLSNPEIQIFTTKLFYPREKEKIDKIISNNNIKRIIKSKDEIEHSRYWILNNDIYYKAGKSLDGIHKTAFDLYDLKDIERIAPKVIKLKEELSL